MTIFTVLLVLILLIGIPYLIYQTFINGWLDKLINDFTSIDEDVTQVNPVV